MHLPNWHYNEFQQIGTDFEDSYYVEIYDCQQSSSSPEAEQQLVQRLGIAKGDRVIDLGCGTGTFAIQAALAGAQVKAVDISPVMLNYARQKAAIANAETIEFCHSGFLTYEPDSDLADHVVTKSALHHLPDFWKMIAILRMAACLKPRGVLYIRDTVFSFNPTEYRTHINQWIENAAKPAAQGWTASDFETHVREEYTTFGWVLEGMLVRAGFEIEVAHYLTPTHAEYVCTNMFAKQTHRSRLHEDKNIRSSRTGCF
ncbi:MAG: class I SAM-dependent methyltransferase [Elainellaceae cyanobacterium]